jgi:glutamyl-tRNA reductase
MKIFVAGLSYKTAPIELREQLAVSRRSNGCTACRLKITGDLSEVVLLSTCNRVEVYGVAPYVNGNVPSMFRSLAGGRSKLDDYLYLHEDRAAVRHLFAVASGLDSMVIGETEITGQVKHAYQAAQESRLTGRVLNRLFQTALHTAKQVRTETQIGRGSVSVGSVAVDLAQRIFAGDLTDKTLMIIGAGKMGEACVRHLAGKGARSVLVSNRSFERAQSLATEFGGRAIQFSDCLAAMVEADIVVSSTGCPTTILNRAEVESVMRRRRHRPLFLIDIAVPRDVDPATQRLENVYLYNIDNLQALVRENMRIREQEIARCHEIINHRAEALMAKLAPPPITRQPRDKQTNDICIQPEPSWIFCGAAPCHG